MTNKVTFNEETKIIEFRVDDNFDWDLIEKMVPELGRFIKSKGSTLILLDFRNSKINMSTVTIYETPEKIVSEYKKAGVDARIVRRAVLINPGQTDFNFLEDVSENNGQSYKLFTDEKLAIDWLKSF
jgi:hypothetical protein